jgi:TPR repeat protein
MFEGCSIRLQEDGRMKSRILLPLLLLLLIPVGRSTAQQSFDSKQSELTLWARLKSMTSSDLQTLMAKAQGGDSEAQCWVGYVYGEGRLMRKDAEEAARWFLKSAEQGYPPAQRIYGLMSVPINPSVGERWMLRAAEQGDAEAQFWLGFAYEQNWFGTTDVREAVKWYQKAAEGGNPDAQAELGEKYELGEGVEQSFKLAAEWYRKAAEHVPNLGGAGQGRNGLGLLYMKGRGVPRDYVQAYFWFSLDGPEENTAEAKAHLSVAQVRETDRLVKEWKAQHRLSPEVAVALHIEN